MSTFKKHRAYSILALLLALSLLCGCAAPAAVAAQSAATPTPPSTVPDSPAPTAAPTPSAEKNGMYDLLTEVFERYHPGTAGSSLTAAFLAATMVDWAGENGLDAVRAGARAWDRGMETEYGESFAEKISAMRDAALSIAAGGKGILADCGYEGEWDHTAQEVTETFDAILDGLGLEAAADTAVPSAQNGTVIVSIERESEEYYDSREGETLILYYGCAWPTVAIPENAAAETAINAALEEQRLRYVVGPEEEQEGVTDGRENFLHAAEEDLKMRTEDGYAEYFFPYSYQREVDIPRADGSVLSVVYGDYSYMGGAHGYNFRNTCIFDTRTGAELSIEALGEDGVDILAELAEMLLRVAESPEYGIYSYWEDYREILPTLLRDGNWYFSHDGLVVMANPYEMDSYAAGLIEFTIPYAWLAGKLRGEYLPSDAAPEGSLEGEILPAAAQPTYLVDDGTDGAGAAVTFTARGRVEDVALRHVSYSEYTNTFWEGELLWYGALNDGESLTVLTWIPDAAPNLAITYTDAGGERRDYISMSGMDGSLVLMEERDYPALPREITRELPFAYDLDGDWERETIELRHNGARWELLVNGTAVAADSYAMDAQEGRLWLSDIDYDGVAELFFTGDMGSDDYVTCGWRGDTLQPITFAGDTRYGRSGEATDTADGELCFSLGYPVLRSFVYQMGTYAAFRTYTLTDGVLVPTEASEWTYRSNTFVLETVQELPVVWEYGGEGLLPVGSRIILKGSDGNTARFVTEDGERGSIELSYRSEGMDSGWFIRGVSENKYFAMLPYVG